MLRLFIKNCLKVTQTKDMNKLTTDLTMVFISLGSGGALLDGL